MWCGELDAAQELVVEQAAVKEITGARMASYTPPLLTAYRGRLAESEALDLEVVEDADGLAFETANLAKAVLNNGLGRYAEACAAAREVTLFSLLMFSLPELIEAAVRTGELELARDALADLEPHVVPGSDWAAGIQARCQALVCDSDEAEHWFQEGVASLSRTPLRLDMARAHLLYGEWLRGEARLAEAREQLRQAYTVFDATGAAGFAERARTELVAAGEKQTRREVSQTHELTPRRSTSRGWLETAAATPRSGPSCSSAPAPSSGTCARSSSSLASAPATAFETHCHRPLGASDGRRRVSTHPRGMDPGPPWCDPGRPGPTVMRTAHTRARLRPKGTGMTTKISIIYDNPTNPDDFEAAYPDLLALARKIPGILRIETSKVWPKEDGSPTPAYRMIDMYLPGYDEASQAVTTPEAEEFFILAFDLATGGARAVFFDVEES